MNKVMTLHEESGTLVVFTALAPLAVGGLVGLLIARGTREMPGIDRAAALVLVVGILALVVSTLHLGRPWRAPLALLHLSTSWLSREVILFGLFLLLLACFASLPVYKPVKSAVQIIGIVSAVIGLAGTVATGETYRLPSRPSWDHWLTTISIPLSALSTGLLFGFFAARVFTANQEIAKPAWILAGVLLILSVVVSCVRTIGRNQGAVELQLSRQLVIGTYLWLLLIRMILVVLAIAMVWIGAGAQYLAWVPALLGEFADRILFFKTVKPVTLRGRYT